MNSKCSATWQPRDNLYAWGAEEVQSKGCLTTVEWGGLGRSSEDETLFLLSVVGITVMVRLRSFIVIFSSSPSPVTATSGVVFCI